MYRTLPSRGLWKSAHGSVTTLSIRTLNRATPKSPTSIIPVSTKRFIETASKAGDSPRSDPRTVRPVNIDHVNSPSFHSTTDDSWQMPSLSFIASPSTVTSSTSTTLGTPETLETPITSSNSPRPSEDKSPDTGLSIKRSLPPACTGCGAFTQTQNPQFPGFFDTNRKSVRRFLGLDEKVDKKPVDIKENHQVLAVINQIGADRLKQLGIDPKTLILDEDPDLELKKSQDGVLSPPLCDRCHVLIHHRVGQPIFHPTTHALRETLEESPWKYNHVFHVIDAADFPMSLVPRLNQLIGDIRLRTRNRRSIATHFQHDRALSMNFVITRSDLLAPKKEQVDSLMPYLREVLREALGRTGRMVRLGNMWCVSSKRAWWTADLREEIFRRGGASWLVGKINVGKSQLFESAFPKGRLPAIPGHSADENTKMDEKPQVVEGLDPLKVGEWLPPARKEEMYPAMPTVSDLAGTTASPIRIPFGGGRGELIDLPGLARTTLTNHVMTKYRDQLIMKSRIVPEQKVIKAGQSLMIGGMFRFTPRSPDVVILAYNFTPMDPHITNTRKAIEITEQRSDLLVNNIAVPGVGSDMKLAGSFALRYDVTKERAGPLTQRHAVNFKVTDLPFRVLSIDILIESVGWVELVAQVRTRSLYNDRPASDYENSQPRRPEGPEAWDIDADERPPKAKYTPRFKGEGPWHPEFTSNIATTSDPTDPWANINQATSKNQESKMQAKQIQANARRWDAVEQGTDVPKTTEGELPEEEQLPEPNWPIIDVFSPHGHFVGARRPMNGWLLNKPLVTSKQKRSRPRKSMKGEKKKSKRMLRMAKSTYFTG
ncbi:hypothetical protein CFIMG_002817RA [Ceratocystis fimbriata CBS 114723]|uniref:Genetic interactor of prohibitins 3, mitochondrial n=1 Tax=Ceratocystis fimbriata CBS 114723 TaxID=1035309 RepID=A0A2C5X914_9PEZI|nr:hypothetical protein CFIMG_002817RA [Ceratocystis fimbriata CBS 114723]